MKNFFLNKNVLVTGSCGSVGSQIINRLIKYNCKKIIGVDNNEGLLFFSKRGTKKV